MYTEHVVTQRIRIVLFNEKPGPFFMAWTFGTGDNIDKMSSLSHFYLKGPISPIFI